MQREAPVPALASDSVASSANSDATITLAAPGSGIAHSLAGVAWSYSGTPTGGSITITDGGASVFFGLDISATGPASVPFDPSKVFSDNGQVVITLAAAGSGVVGKLTLLGREIVRTSDYAAVGPLNPVLHS
jgi:hypothetical protein